MSFEMNPFPFIEKLINEHGSAAILGQQLALAKDEFSALERQVGEFQAKIAKLEAQLEIERTNHNEIKHELQRLKDEHSEEIRIHKLVEFRRGIRTGNKWTAFCPKCHLPVTDSQYFGRWIIKCTGGCGWMTPVVGLDIGNLIKELDAKPV
jgi:hypothetical protein